MTNTAIGQQSIIYNGVRYTMTPSFVNLSGIDDPVGYLQMLTNQETLTVDALGAAVATLNAMSDKPLPVELTGEPRLSYDGKRWLILQGRMPVSDVIIMASDLLYMGLIGKPRKLKKQSSASGSDFDASKFVGVAVAQLGMSPRDAWEMCLVDFQRAIEAKYPEMFASDASITAAEYDDLVKSADDAVKRLEAKRKHG